MLPHASHRRLRNDLAAKRHPPFRLPFFVVTAFSIRPDVELDAPPIWKSAAQHVRKPALRTGGFHYMNVLEDPPKKAEGSVPHNATLRIDNVGANTVPWSVHLPMILSLIPPAFVAFAPPPGEIVRYVPICFCSKPPLFQRRSVYGSTESRPTIQEAALWGLSALPCKTLLRCFPMPVIGG
jgi:hypothetical protein